MPIGTRDIDSTPQAIAMSYAPLITPCAAMCAACWDEPHCRSTVMPGTLSGNPAASTACAGDVERLVPDLRDAAADDVVDERGIDPGPLDERHERAGQQVHGALVVQRPSRLALAHRRTNRLDDHRVPHHDSLPSPLTMV